MQQSSDRAQPRLGVSLNHMAKKKKGKFFLELDEDKGLWKVGKGDEPAPAAAPATETQPAVESQTAAESQTGAAPASTASEDPAPAPAAEPISLVGFFDNRPEEPPAEETTEPENTFAATNPLPLSLPGRRGPGPSLGMFKEMARKVNRSSL